MICVFSSSLRSGCRPFFRGRPSHLLRTAAASRCPRVLLPRAAVTCGGQAPGAKGDQWSRVLALFHTKSDDRNTPEDRIRYHPSIFFSTSQLDKRHFVVTLYDSRHPNGIFIEAQSVSGMIASRAPTAGVWGRPGLSLPRPPLFPPMDVVSPIHDPSLQHGLTKEAHCVFIHAN